MKRHLICDIFLLLTDDYEIDGACT